MTDDQITDGKRIAQLLASELSGLDREPLDTVSVGDADPDATPSERGTEAYQIRSRGVPVATVCLYPERATVCLHGDRMWSAVTNVDAVTTGTARAASATLSVDGSALEIPTGATVKRAVDAIAALVDSDRPADAGE